MVLVVCLYLLVVAPLLANRDEDAASSLASPTARPSASSQTVEIRYFITGSNPELHERITYLNPDGAAQDIGDYQGPWDKVLTFKAGTRITLVAQAGSPFNEADSITCEIQRDGKTLQKQTATGTSATVTCSTVVAP
jgi:hypothetical protein